MIIGRLVASAAVLLALAGCAQPAAPGAPTPAETAEPALRRPLFPPTAPEILAFCPASDATHLAEGGSPDEIYVCTASEPIAIEPGIGDDQPLGGADSGGGRRLEVANRVVSGADELLATYAEPNAQRPSDVACIEMAMDPLIVWVAAAGRTTPVYAPVDECGFPQEAASAAYAALGFEEVARVDRPVGE
jgi:hypothetical protein